MVTAVGAAGLFWLWRSHDVVADGVFRFYLAAGVSVVGLALLAAGGLMDARLPSAVPILAGALVLAVGTLIPHAARAAALSLAQRAEAHARLTPADPGTWLVSTLASGEFSALTDRVILTAPPLGGVYVELNGRDVAQRADQGREMWRRLGFAPIARQRFETDETLRWRASYSLDAAYFTVVETEGVLVQLFAPGLLVQRRSSSRAAFGTGVVVPLSPGALDSARELTLARSPAGATLALDGTEVWRGPRQPAFGLIKLGEPRPGSDHAGRAAVFGALYERRLAADRLALDGVEARASDLASHAFPTALATALMALALVARHTQIRQRAA